MSNFSVRALSMFKILISAILFLDIQFLKKFLVNLSFSNDRFADASTTGLLKIIIHKM